MNDVNYKNEAQEFIEKLFEFKRDKCEGLSMMETMIEYGYKFDIPLQEMGNIISDHKEFLLILENQLEEEGYIRKEKTELDSIQLDENEW